MNSFPEIRDTYLALSHLLFPPLALALIGLIALVFKLVRQKSALKVERDSAISTYSESKKQIGQLEADKLDLQSQLAPYIDRASLCEGLQIHAPSQTLFDPATGKHYCLVCMQKTPPDRIEIKDCGGGFHCDICQNTFADQSRPIEVTAIPPSESVLRHRKLFQR